MILKWFRNHSSQLLIDLFTLMWFRNGCHDGNPDVLVKPGGHFLAISQPSRFRGILEYFICGWYAPSIPRSVETHVTGKPEGSLCAVCVVVYVCGFVIWPHARVDNSGLKVLPDLIKFVRLLMHNLSKRSCMHHNKSK